MAQTIRWGIVGTGMVARDVARSFSQVADAELLAVASRNQDTADAFARCFGVKMAYDSFDALLANPDVDVVYIATPHHRHRDDSLKCFAAGKAVLCEKPFTLNAREATEVIAMAREKKLFCMEAMWMRFIPLIREIKRRIDAGEIGDVQMLKADFGYPIGFDPESRFFSLEKGGGSLMDRGIYTLSLANYLLGQHETLVSHAAIGKTGVDEQSACLLGYEKGAIADLASTLTTYGTNEAVVMGNRGQIRIHDPFYRPSRISLQKFPAAEPVEVPAIGESAGMKQKLKDNALVQKLYRLVSPVLEKLGGAKTISQPFAGDGYQFEIEEVTQCLQRGDTESAVMPLDDTLAIMETMDAMRQQWGLRYPQEQ
ncbi:MAG TPA: Gfo/Idh/MocA family oxidoreductase [Gammaproteobacteria bacterium]|nr:Gfo/Idh/MocA family oxidoreductase [Gammaproteobacteria bacterium]